MRKCLPGSLLTALASLACAGGLLAADKPEHDGHSHTPPASRYKVVDRDHHEHEFDRTKEEDKQKLLAMVAAGQVHEMEPLETPDPMKLQYDLALWSLVIFGALIFLLRKFAWGPILEGLQKREGSIRLAVDEAKLAREETERLRAQFKTEMDQAFAKIPQLMAEARRDAEKLSEEMRAKAGKEIADERQRLRREIEVARDQALQELWNNAAQLATLISAKAIGRSLTAEDHTRLVDESLQEIRKEAPR